MQFYFLSICCNLQALHHVVIRFTVWTDEIAMTSSTDYSHCVPGACTPGTVATPHVVWWNSRHKWRKATPRPQRHYFVTLLLTPSLWWWCRFVVAADCFDYPLLLVAEPELDLEARRFDCLFDSGFLGFLVRDRVATFFDVRESIKLFL